eukprot:3242094-Ditylum_brightwellii.AAC.1
MKETWRSKEIIRLNSPVPDMVMGMNLVRRGKEGKRGESTSWSDIGRMEKEVGNATRRSGQEDAVKLHQPIFQYRSGRQAASTATFQV